jgi:serpin B
MGMPQAFSQKADFTGVAKAKELTLAAVVHKAYVDVDEKGTEAVAASKATTQTKSAPRKPPPTATFRADHPFLFLIRDRNTGSILFIGRLTDPRKR